MRLASGDAKAPGAECGYLSDSVMRKQPARQRVVFRPGCRRHGPELRPGAMRSGVALGLSPAGPSSSAPTPWKGRSADCALDLDRANAAPGSYVQVPAFGPAPLAAARSQPNPEQARRSSFRANHARVLLLVLAPACLVACVPADRTLLPVVFGG